MQLQIVLAVTLFMMIMFIWNKVPFGVTTMTCCIILAVTGVIELKDAFSGFGNKIVVLIAPTLALSSALKKTDLIDKVSGMLNRLQGKKGTALVAAFFAVGIIFAQFIPTTAAIAILVIFLGTLDATGEVTPYRITMPLLAVMVAWKFRSPLGIGATTFAMLNGMYEGIINEPQFQLKMLDPFIFSLIPGVILTVYCIFAWKLMPKSDAAIDKSALKTIKTEELPKNKQMIVYAVFAVVMLTMLLNNITKDLMYLAPAAGVVVLVMTGCLGAREASNDMTVDMIWMLAGVLVVADALGKSGAGDLIGNILLGILNVVHNHFVIYLIFAFVTIIMTTFISNMATQTVLIPIAASVALAGGWDPRGLILIIGTANYIAIAFPSGSGEAAVTFAVAGYNPVKILKFTLPFILLAAISMAVSAQIFYPLH